MHYARRKTSNNRPPDRPTGRSAPRFDYQHLGAVRQVELPLPPPRSTRARSQYPPHLPKTVTESLPTPAALGKAEREVGEFRKFATEPRVRGAQYPHLKQRRWRSAAKKNVQQEVARELDQPRAAGGARQATGIGGVEIACARRCTKPARRPLRTAAMGSSTAGQRSLRRPPSSIPGTALQVGSHGRGQGACIASLYLCGHCHRFGRRRTRHRPNRALPEYAACRRWWASRLPSITGAGSWNGRVCS